MDEIIQEYIEKLENMLREAYDSLGEDDEAFQELLSELKITIEAEQIDVDED